MQVVGCDALFAVGDCNSFDAHEGAFPPKAGVYAVRLALRRLTRYLLISGLHLSNKALVVHCCAFLPIQARTHSGTQPTSDHEARAAEVCPPSICHSSLPFLPTLPLPPFLGSHLHTCYDSLREYHPQAEFLSLLITGRGTAIGTKWGITMKGRYALVAFVCCTGAM